MNFKTTKQWLARARHMDARLRALQESKRIADMEEINAFWTDVVRDKKEKTADRLKASELRARSAGAFIEKVQHSGEVQVNPFAGLTTEELRKLAGQDG